MQNTDFISRTYEIPIIKYTIISDNIKSMIVYFNIIEGHMYTL